MSHFPRKAGRASALARASLIVVFSALVCVACGGGGGSDAPAPPVTPPAPVTAPVVGVRFYIELQAAPSIPAGNYVFQSQDEFAAVWNSAPPSALARLSPDRPYVVPPVPTGIDFQTSTLVAVSLGAGIPCHTPQIVDMSITDGTLVVKWTAHDPNDFGCTLASLHAAEMLDTFVIPKFTGPVVFQHVAS